MNCWRILNTIIAILVLGCGGSGRLNKYYTEEDRSVLDLIAQVKKEPTDKASIRLLSDAYEAAFQKRARMAQPYAGSQAGDQYMQQVKEWQVVGQMFEQIRAIPEVAKQLPGLPDPGPQEQQVRQQAAEQYYQAGRAYLGIIPASRHNRPMIILIKPTKPGRVIKMSTSNYSWLRKEH